MALFQV